MYSDRYIHTHMNMHITSPAEIVDPMHVKSSVRTHTSNRLRSQRTLPRAFSNAANSSRGRPSSSHAFWTVKGVVLMVGG
jgi:hypothetical protein